MMTVSPVSWSDLILKVGSSSERRLRAMPIFSWSALVFGSMRKEITGSGKVIRSRMMGLFSSQKVCEVFAFFRPTAAALSHQWLNCIDKYQTLPYPSKHERTLIVQQTDRIEV